MTKADMIEKVAEITGTKKSAESALGCVLALIAKGLKKEGAVTLVGFGSFKVVKRAARKGRNPQTGETIKIKASKTVKFSPSKNLKDTL